MDRSLTTFRSAAAPGLLHDPRSRAGHVTNVGQSLERGGTGQLQCLNLQIALFCELWLQWSGMQGRAGEDASFGARCHAEQNVTQVKQALCSSES